LITSCPYPYRNSLKEPVIPWAILQQQSAL